MIETRDGITIIGTAHVLKSSVEEVETTIRALRPQKVLVEIDPARLKALQDPEAWRNTDIFQVLRQKKQHLFLLQLYLAAMQAQMGRETGVAPGMDMLRAVQVGEEVGAEVVLVDRDVSVTLKRGFGSMGMWARMRLFWKVWLQVLTPTDRSQPPPDLEEVMQSDAITQMTEEFARFAPAVKTALIDERDAYMASHIQEQARTSAGPVVAVVGAGHLKGIRTHLDQGTAPVDRTPLDALPPKRLGLGKILAYAVPLLIIALFVWLGVTGRYAQLLDVGLAWILINGGLAALGVAIALGHPLSMLVAFVAAPITSLHPAIAAGWFAGLTEAKMRTPKVMDFEAIKLAESTGQFLRNPVVRVLLVTALANLGSMVGTYVAGAHIVRSIFGGG